MNKRPKNAQELKEAVEDYCINIPQSKINSMIMGKIGKNGYREGGFLQRLDIIYKYKLHFMGHYSKYFISQRFRRIYQTGGMSLNRSKETEIRDAPPVDWHNDYIPQIGNGHVVNIADPFVDSDEENEQNEDVEEMIQEALPSPLPVPTSPMQLFQDSENDNDGPLMNDQFNESQEAASHLESLM